MDPGSVLPEHKEDHKEDHKEEVVQRSEDAAPPPAVSTGPPSAGVRRVLRSIVIHSLAVAVVIPALFSYSAGEPVVAGWTMSLFAVAYLFSCSVAYSTAPPLLAKIFLALSYLALVAFCVGILVSRVMGMVLIYIDSILAAGLFGTVLADHRQSEGTEMAANRAVHMAPPGMYRRQLGVYFFLVLLVLFYAICWVMVPEADYDPIDVAMGLFGLLAFLLLIQTICVLGWLNGAVLGADSSPPVVASFATIAMLFTLSYILAGELIAVTILWLCLLAAASYLGYYLQVHSTYEQIMLIRNATRALTTDYFAAAASTTQRTSSTAPGEETTDGSAAASSTTQSTPPTAPGEHTTDGFAVTALTTASGTKSKEV